MDYTHLEYKKNASETADRLSLLWSRGGRDRIFAMMEVPNKALREFAESHRDGLTDFPDAGDRIAFWDAHLAEQRDLQDDWLPHAYLSEFDQGVYGGMLGAPVRYMMHTEWGIVSSMAPPVIRNIEDIATLSIDRSAGILKLLDKQVKYYKNASRNRFGVAPFIVIDAMNFVSEVRGATRSFEDVYDHPDHVTRIMDFALELNILLQSQVHDAVGGFMGGKFVQVASWAPGTAVSFSVDAYHMASPDFYYRWGEPHIQRLLDHFGGGVLHVHSNGFHLLEHVAKLRGLIGIELADEAGYERACEQLDRLASVVGDVPLLVQCEWDEFCEAIENHRLPGNIRYTVQNAPCVSEANTLMEKVRKYTAVTR